MSARRRRADVRRRVFLAAAAGVLGGCSGLDEGATEPTLTPAPVPTAGSAPTPDPFAEAGPSTAATLGRSAAGGRTFSLFPRTLRTAAAEVSLAFVAPATAERPALVRATLRRRDDASASAATGEAAGILPFVALPGLRRAAESNLPGPETLYLAPTRDTGVATDVPAVERAPGSSPTVWRLAAAARPWLQRRALPPADEPLSATFRLVAGPSAERPPLGTYRGAVRVPASPTLAVWETDAPGPREPSRFAPGREPVPADELPPLPADTTRWFHRTPPDTARYLRPSTERLELPATVSATLVNHATEPLSASRWAFFRLDGGRWFRLGPLFRRSALRPLVPGDRLTWRFELAHDGRPPAPDTSRSRDGRFGFLGGGVYALAGRRAATDRLFGAVLRVEAPPLAVRPTDDARVTRDGPRVTVRTAPAGSGGDSAIEVLQLDRLPLGDATATRTTTGDDGADPLRRLVAEQVMRSRGLRNTLGVVGEGVERVRLRANGTVVRRALRRVDFRVGSRRFRFDGDRFRVTVGSTRGSRDSDGTDDTRTGTGTTAPGSA